MDGWIILSIFSKTSWKDDKMHLQILLQIILGDTKGPLCQRISLTVPSIMYDMHLFYTRISKNIINCRNKLAWKLHDKRSNLGGSVVSVSDSWPGGCEFDPRLRRLFFPAYFRLSPLQEHVRKVVGGFGKKSCVSTGVRKPGNTYASPTAMIWPWLLKWR